MADLTQFEPFSRLPKELRFKIWKVAAHFPRIVELCIKHPDRRDAEAKYAEDDDGEGSDTEKTEAEKSETMGIEALGIEDEKTETEEIETEKSDAEGNGPENRDDDDSNEEEDHSWYKDHDYYTRTAPPSILHANQESRFIALPYYTPPFRYLPLTFYNAAVDILYFPPLYFESSICNFEHYCSSKAKTTIRKIAIEPLCWYGMDEDGSINNQCQVSDFGNLEEFYLVGREPDYTGCGCMHGCTEEPKGVIGFERELEEGEEVEEGGKGMDKTNRCFSSRVRREVEEEFARIKAGDASWRMPELKLVRLKRNGLIV